MRPPPEKDQRFGRLRVLDPEVRKVYPSNPKGVRAALCRCDCDDKEVIVTHAHLRGGTESCGCLQREATRELNRTPEHIAQVAALIQSPGFIAGHVAATTTHGLSDHPLYDTHRRMLDRCENEKHKHYKNYGGREDPGPITVYGPWHDLATFIKDVEAEIGPRPAGMTLDRINNDLGYKPGNIRWADDKTQNRNSRNAKLNVKLVRLLKRAVKLGMLKGPLAACADISESHLDAVLRGDSWSDVDDDEDGAAS